MATRDATLVSHDASPEWGRGRMLAVLTAAVCTVLLLVLGLGYAVRRALVTDEADDAGLASLARSGAPANVEGIRGSAYRDQLAAASMTSVPAAASRPGGVLARASAPTMVVPAATRSGPAGVPSGFPRTPEGATAQLAAIETRVLQAMDLRVAKDVHAAWSLPGAPAVDEWALTSNVRAFLGSLGLSESLDPGTSVAVVPAAAMVKGVDGQDWVLGCVLVTVSATAAQTASMGWGHCERLQWHDGRWMLAPGAPPAPAPSVWPGTQLAADLGWRTITSESAQAR